MRLLLQKETGGKNIQTVEKKLNARITELNILLEKHR
jgi:hypothetical protein